MNSMPVMLEEGLLGRRVVIRYRRTRPAGQPPLSDVIGTLTELTADSATVLTRNGPEFIDRQSVVAAKPVQASTREILNLERISRLGWRAAHRTELDGWLLFTDQGWTGRANSALPLVSLTRPLDEVLPELRVYYAARGLPTLIQVPLPARDALDLELARRSWSRERPTVVLTRPIEPLPTPATDSHVLAEFADAPEPDWIAAYHYRGGTLPDFARELLTRHHQVTFASLRRAGRTVAIARGVVDEGWLGVTAVEVPPDCRRQGLAGRIMAELLAWGRSRAAQQCYLQVDEGNQAALTLYAGLGFIEHHRYHYRVEPDANRRSEPSNQPHEPVRPA